MTSKITNFGSHQGQDIQLYSLENEKGMAVKITNYGATITSISVPDPDKSRVDLVCGFDMLEGYFSEEYQANAPYFGCTVGRYSSRIKDGRFEINGKEFTVACNDGPNHLHGGITGFNKKVWDAELTEDSDHATIKMTMRSPHMDEGYPGNLEVSVLFSLDNNNALTISYEAVTDEETPVSLTNHTYFNLSGFAQTIEEHKATVFASRHLKADETNVPVGEIEALKGTAADLRAGILFKDAFAKLETGFEHYFLFDKELWKLDKVAEFVDTQSGRKLEVLTTEPGMLFYTGYFTSDKLQRESGDQYGRYRGFCCETHRYPNGPNIDNSPASVLKPGETLQKHYCI